MTFKRTVPRLVQVLRALAKKPGHKAHVRLLLLYHASNLLLTIKSMGAPPDRWETLGAYYQAAAQYQIATKQRWDGESG